MGCCFSVEKDDDSSRREGKLHNNLLRERNEDVYSKYEVVQRLGEGSMGAVSKVRVKESRVGGSAYNPKLGCFGWCLPRRQDAISERRAVDVQYAMKTIILSRISQQFIEELRNEISLLKDMDHPNIVKAYEVFETRSQIYIIMECCSGGDLYKRLPYSEKDSAKIVEKLCSAIKYMHDKNIVHRDLKFENIIFENSSPNAEIKVIDFGLSKKFVPEERFMTEGVGTIYTMAPQVLQGIYTSQADLWSIGVISYMLLSSQKPFYSKRRRRVIDKIMRADYDFKAPIWQMISNEARDFVSSLIVLNPSKRLNATQALAHKWLSRSFHKSDTPPPPEFMDDVHAGLLQYKDTSDLKKVALQIIAHKSSTEEIVLLRDAFKEYDKTNDGVISYDEFKAALKSAKYTEKELNDMFSSIDVNQNGVIMYTEFLAASLEAHCRLEEERIAEAFDRMDSDDTGFISKDNLRDLLGRDTAPEQIEAMIKEADTDSDGQISFQEFLVVFQKNTDNLASKVARLESSTSHGESESNLVGLDAKIPGGKYDESVRNGS